MNRRLLWTPTARADVYDIIDYISAENPDAAERAAQKIETVANNLAVFATGRQGRVTGTYEKLVTGLPYIIAYEIKPLPDGSEMVIILHLIHAAREWQPGSWPPSD